MFDIYAAVTDRIISELEKGVIPWKKPWIGGANVAISHDSGKPYSLLNQMILGNPGEYITWTQIQKEGGKVKKGAKAKMVVFWKLLPRDKQDKDGNAVLDADGQPVKECLPVLKYFNVFHIDDVEGIKPKYSNEELPAEHADPVDQAEKLFAAYRARTGVKFEQAKQGRAYYSPTADLISLPLMEQFPDTSEFYSTLFHEATHSTGHASRLNRFAADAGAAAFGSDEYSKEELVAEIGAAAILNQLGMETTDSFANSAAYIQSWLQALKGDKRLIVGAAARAEKAVSLIMGAN